MTALAPRLDDPARTPSGRLLDRLESTGESFLEAMLGLAREQAEAFRETPMDPAREALFDELVATSHAQQADIEAADEEDFDTFLARYFERAREVRSVTPLQTGEPS